ALGNSPTAWCSGEPRMWSMATTGSRPAPFEPAARKAVDRPQELPISMMAPSSLCVTLLELYTLTNSRVFSERALQVLAREPVDAILDILTDVRDSEFETHSGART